MYNEYPYTDFHELNLDWFLAEFKQVHDHVDDLDATVTEFTQFVTDYFDNLDVQEEINNKLDALVADGTIADLLLPLTTDAVGDWLEDHITPTTPPVDDTLTIAGAAADAKITGDEISNLKVGLSRLDDISYNISDDSMPLEWFERGSITSGANDEYRSGSRARTKNILEFDSISFITVKNGQYLIVYYDSTSTWTSNSGWKTTTDILLIPKNQKFRIIITPDNAASASVTYSLEDMVENAIFKLDSVQNNKRNILDLTFEHGGLAQGADDTYNQAARCRTTEICEFPFDVNISMSSGSYAIHFFDDNGVFTNIATWRTTEKYNISAYTKFRLVITNDPASAAYADLDTLVNNLQIEMVQITITKNIFDLTFERGGLHLGVNDTYNENARCRTTEICEFSFDVNISMSSGSYAIHFFDDNGVFTNNTTWRTTEKYNIPAYTKFRLVITNDPASAIYFAIDTLVDYLQVDMLQSNVPISLSPNIIYQCRNVSDSYIPPESKWYVRAAAANQYDRVRFTVRKTIDGYYFNCHDDTINNVARNPDGTEISASISANGQTLATLNSYDWGIKYGAKYAGATVPLLEETLKYAAIFNMGVTWHAATALVETDSDIANILAMIDKYGLTDNLIVVTSTGQSFETMQKFLTHNPRISYYIGGLPAFFADNANINSIKALQTGFNKIYVQLYPWGTAPTDEFISFAKENNFLLYNSITMSQASLLDEDTFSRGYSIMEINNVYHIKDTVRNWANSLID